MTDPKTGESIQQIIQTVIDPKTGKPKQIKTPINAGNDFLMKKTQIQFYKSTTHPLCFHIFYFWKTKGIHIEKTV